MRFARAWAVCLSIFTVAAFALAVPAHAQSQQQPRVYLLRGLANIFSLGMDDLAAKLNARGIKASVHPYTDVEAVSRYAIEQAATGKRPSPVIIIGHSLGADYAIYMANRVAGAGVPVPLVVTFDPVNYGVASAKVGKVVNYYQAGGSGKPVSGPRVENIDLTSSGGLSHFNIEKAAELHSRVIAMIQRPARPVATRPRPKPPANPTASAPAPAATPAAAAPTTETTPAATPASTPASPVTPASSTTSSVAPAAGTETAAAASAAVVPPAGVGTSN